VMPALFGRHLIDKAIFLALEDMADNLPRLREYVGGPPQPDYDDGDHRFRPYSSRACQVGRLAAAIDEPAEMHQPDALVPCPLRNGGVALRTTRDRTTG
jgi:hypothetical protein